MSNITGERRWWMLTALCLATLVLGLDFTILNVALPTISAELGAGTDKLQWIIDAFALSVAACMLPAGAIGDRVGRKRMLLIGLGVFFVGSIAAALSTSSGELIASRLFLGIGSAIVLPMVPAMIVLYFEGRDRTRAMGAFTGSLGLGLPLGPVVGGFLLQHFYWGSVFWINVPILAVSIVVGIFLIPESRNPHPERLDVVGVLLAVLGIVALVYGIIRGPNNGWVTPGTLGTLIAAVVLLAAFALWERRVAAPLVQLSMLRDPAFTWNTVVLMIVSFILSGLVFVVPQFLQLVQGYDAQGTGLRVAPLMGGLLVAGGLASVADRLFGTKAVAAAGQAALFVGLAVLARTGLHTNYGLTAAALVVCGAGVGIVTALVIDIAIEAAGGGSEAGTETGSASAVVNTLRQVGSALAVAVLGAVLSAVYAQQLAHSLGGLPAQAAAQAKQSVTAAAGIAGRLGSGGTALRQAAAHSFVVGMDASLWVCAGLALLGTLAAIFFLPRHVRETGVEHSPADSSRPVIVAE